VCNLDGGGLKQLTRTRDEDSCPTWSPDSREICFVCRSGRAELQKISASGGPARAVRVAGVYGNLTSPDWSPDGKWIAFTSGSGNFTICVAPAEGGDAQNWLLAKTRAGRPIPARLSLAGKLATNESYVCLTCRRNTSRMSGKFREAVRSLHGQGENRFP
jgi:dipeptidyl aminopeptidase/acylaminoacyl peptidase